MEQKFVTLPREVVERAIEALRGSETPTYRAQYDIEIDALVDLSAALDQPQNHVPDAGNMVQAGWRLVPVEPTEKMVDMGRGLSSFPDGVYRAMLSAAPQPPAVEQPQANQPAMTPIAQRKLDSMLAEGYTISGYSIYHEQKHQHGFVTGAGLVGWWQPDGMEYPQPQGEQEPVAWQSIEAMAAQRYKVVPSHDSMFYRHAVVAGDGTQQLYIGRETECENMTRKFAGAFLDGAYVASLYTHPQPKRDPLTDKQISRLWSDAHNDTTDRMAFQVLARAIEAAHNIK